jgi:hypothetical protein
MSLCYNRATLTSREFRTYTRSPVHLFLYLGISRGEGVGVLESLVSTYRALDYTIEMGGLVWAGASLTGLHFRLLYYFALPCSLLYSSLISATAL